MKPELVPGSRVIFADPNFLLSSPSMRSIVLAVPALRKMGIEVEVWANQVEAGVSVDKWVKFPFFRLPSPLNYWIYSIVVTLYRMLIFTRRSRLHRARSVVISTGFYSWICDYAFLHFSNLDWVGKQLRIGLNGLKDWLEWVRSLASLGVDFGMANNPFATCLCPVSQSVAGDFQTLACWTRDIRVMPNARGGGGFSAEQRLENRSASRERLGFEGQDLVFAMTAMGHLRRKGFLNAVLALVELRRLTGRRDIRFLFIGGNSKALSKIQTLLDERVTDWRDWICLTGMVHDVPAQLSAADAFLFPSYSEAFSLAEIEASAMGLRLYLTPHHGSEMILEDLKNGRFIPWEPVGIAKILLEDIQNGEMKCHSGYVGKSLSQEEYGTTLADLVLAAIQRKKSV